MQCPACGSEKYRVLRQPQRGLRSERRLVECVDCENKMNLVNGIESVRVLNPVTMRRFDLPIEALNEQWLNYLLGRGPYPGNGKEC